MSTRRRTLCCVLLLGGFAVSLLRTVRAPNDWAEAHWLLDYRFGFVKRGLPGQLLTWSTDLIGVPVTEALVAGIGHALLAVFAAVMLAMALRIVRATGWRTGPVAAMVVLLTSPFAVLAGHLVGYFDHAFFVLGVLSLWLVRRGAVWAGAVVQAVALLVHESCVLLVYPAFVLACALRPAPRPWLPLALPAATALLMAVVLSTPPAGFEAGFTAHLRAAGFVVGGMAENTPKMLAFSLWTMWTLVSHFLVDHFGRHAFAFALVAPTVLVLGLLARPLLPPGRRAVVLLVAAVALAPLPMHAVAWDIERIWTYPIFTTFAAVWVLVGAGPETTAARPRLLPWALVALVANLVLTPPLLDDAVDHLGLPVRVVLLVALSLGLLSLDRCR